MKLLIIIKIKLSKMHFLGTTNLKVKVPSVSIDGHNQKAPSICKEVILLIDS